MFVIFKLIETGAGRREQHGVARPGAFERQRHGALQSAGALERHRAAELRVDLLRGRADQQNQAGALAQQRNQRSVVAALILAAQNDEQAAGKSFQGLDAWRPRWWPWSR